MLSDQKFSLMKENEEFILSITDKDTVKEVQRMNMGN